MVHGLRGAIVRAARPHGVSAQTEGFTAKSNKSKKLNKFSFFLPFFGFFGLFGFAVRHPFFKYPRIPLITGRVNQR
jgi:hypothetical protein